MADLKNASSILAELASSDVRISTASETEKVVSKNVEVYIDQLSPPAGTSFFSKQEFPLFDDSTLLWKVTAYVYITRADPRQPNFQENGGEVQVALLHSGYVFASAEESTKSKVQLYCSPPSGLTPDLQLPATGSGEPEYDGKGEETGNIKYSVQFLRTMPMFTNDGNESFPFDARFENDYKLFHCTQSGSVWTDHSVLGLDGNLTYDPRRCQICGLSTFTSNVLENKYYILMSYWFWHSETGIPSYETKEITIVPRLV